jgi:2-succinyl-5-enolpyruvyl-6-hydroxy-3-cyclohexene-1-carboxylate synthase
MTEADVALACMSAFVDGLVAGGVRDACVSPGSRSTPLALAFARHPGVRVHVHLDERSSAFFGLGVAKATGAPVALACTSGTAAANFLPAVVEASMSRVPLVVLTADRPPELRDVGANQTIDQLGLYGRHVRSFEDAPVPGDEPDPVGWARRGERTARGALSAPPRPVHVNLPFGEPLVPSAALANAVAGPRRRPPAADAGPPAFGAASADVVRSLRGVERGVVYAGGLREPTPAVLELADRLAWPLVAEPQSGVRIPGALSAGQLLLADERFASSHVPDVVLQVGAAPTSRAALALVRRARSLLIVDPDDVVADPHHRADAREVADVETFVRVAIETLGARDETTWLRRWRDADACVRGVVDALLDGWEEPFEGRVARDLADAAPGASVLCVGSSLPVRDVDAYMRPREGLSVLANRGASGIDGFVSTVLGVAAAGRPTYALVGDLTLLHDVGSLVWNARRGLDAVLVVPNNGGGEIFASLEQRALPELEPLFTTPHHADLAAIVRAAGAGHTRVEGASALIPAVGRAAAEPGVHVVEVIVDAGLGRERRARIREAVAAALA